MATIQEQYSAIQANAQNRARAMASLVALLQRRIFDEGLDVILDEITEDRIVLRKVDNATTCSFARISYLPGTWSYGEACYAPHQDLHTVLTYVRAALGLNKKKEDG